MPKIVCQVKNPETGRYRYLRDEKGKRRIFSSFKKAQEAACPEFHPNGQRKFTSYKAFRIDDYKSLKYL